MHSVGFLMVYWICLTGDGIVKAGEALHVFPDPIIYKNCESVEVSMHRVPMLMLDQNMLSSRLPPRRNPLKIDVFHSRIIARVLRLHGGGKNNTNEVNLLRLEGGGKIIAQDAQKQEKKAPEPPPSCLPGSGLACFTNPFLACFLVLSHLPSHRRPPPHTPQLTNPPTHAGAAAR
jgi:hypothetical protein